MKPVKIIIAFVLLIPFLIFIVGFFLPVTSHLERSIDINASAGKVFFLVGDHKEFRRWSPWADMDPNMKVEYSGPGYGKGSVMTWSGNERVNSGTSTFIEHKPNSRAVTRMDFGDGGSGIATYDLVEKDANTTTITWSFDIEHPNVITRYFGLLLDGMLGPIYESGLAKLKTLAESIPDVKTEEVSYSLDGVDFNGFLAYPVGLLDPVPGVLVVHEWWGHNDYARERATMIAQEGYVAVALDMYGDEKYAEHPQDAMKFSQTVAANSDLAAKRFDAAYGILKSHYFTQSSKIAAIGYCYGGAVVLNMALKGKPLEGVVSFHGSLGNLAPIESPSDVPPMLVLNGAADPFVPAEHIEQFKQIVDAAGVPYEFINYEGAQHAFTNPGADKKGEKFGLPLVYNENADKASWSKMRAFLKTVFYKSY